MVDFVETYRGHDIHNARAGYSVSIAGKFAVFPAIGDARAHIDRRYDQLGKPHKVNAELAGNVIEIRCGYQIMFDRDTLQFYVNIGSKEHVSKVIDEIRFAIDKATGVDKFRVAPPGAKPATYAKLELTRTDIVTLTEALHRAMNSLDNDAADDMNNARAYLDGSGKVMTVYAARYNAYVCRAKDKHELVEKMRAMLAQLEQPK